MKKNKLTYSIFFASIIFTALLASLCNNVNTKDEEKKQEKKEVKIPEGQYVRIGIKKDTIRKTKVGKFLKNVANEINKQLYLENTIIVKEQKIISGIINGDKELLIEKSTDNDSLFFIQMPIVGNMKTVPVKLLAGNKLRFSIDNETLNYQLKE